MRDESLRGEQGHCPRPAIDAAGYGLSPETEIRTMLQPGKSGRLLSAQDNHAEHKDTESASDCTKHQGSTHGITPFPARAVVGDLIPEDHKLGRPLPFAQNDDANYRYCHCKRENAHNHGCFHNKSPFRCVRNPQGTRNLKQIWHSLAHLPPRLALRVRNAGANSTMNRQGKIKKTRGNRILILVFAAASSARWRRAMRSSSE
jgi:hypothetical protein